MKSTEISVVGMTCGGCVASVTRALQAVAGVKEVAVSLKPGLARVQYEEAEASESVLRAAVEDAGFDVA